MYRLQEDMLCVRKLHGEDQAVRGGDDQVWVLPGPGHWSRGFQGTWRLKLFYFREPSNSLKISSLQIQFLLGFQPSCHTTSPNCSHAEQVRFPKSALGLNPHLLHRKLFVFFSSCQLFLQVNIQIQPHAGCKPTLEFLAITIRFGPSAVFLLASSLCKPMHWCLHLNAWRNGDKETGSNVKY